MKLCVYTCITGSYDKVCEIKVKEAGVDYYLFTNNKKITSKTWNVVYVEDKSISDQLLSRKIKILGHEIIKKYDISVYIDGNIIIKKRIKDYVKEVMGKKDKYVAFRHSERNSIEEEMEACLTYKKETSDKIEKLKEFYKKEGFKDNLGLAENTIHVKKTNDPVVIKTMNIWYNIVKKYSGRDQLSFMYAVSKTKLNIKWIEKSVWDNEWFTFKKHNEEKLKEDYKVYYKKEGKYTEENIIKGKYKIEKNTFTAEFTLPDYAREIRFDPTEIINMKMSKIKVDGNEKKAIEYFNCLDIDNILYSLDNDPYFIIKGNFKKDKPVKISLLLDNIEKKDIKALVSEINAQQNKIKYYEDREPIIQQDIARLRRIEKSFFWRVYKKIRNIIKKVW